MKKFQALIAVILTISILGIEALTARPVPVARAVPVENMFDLPRVLREFAFNNLAKITARTITAIFIRSLTNWVKSGFKGNPQFVDDPDMFFKNLAKQATLQVQLNLMATKLCYPLGRGGKGGAPQTASTIESPDIPGYPEMRCTMKNPNIQAFFDNFKDGGWQSFGEVLEPQNNVYGLMALMADAKGIEVTKNLGQGKNEFVASQGFLSIKNCGVNFVSDALLNGANFSSNSCAKYKNATPGSIVKAKVESSLSSYEVTDWINVHELSDLIGALINAAVNKFIGTKFMCLSCTGGAPSQPSKTVQQSACGSTNGCSACKTAGDCNAAASAGCIWLNNACLSE